MGPWLQTKLNPVLRNSMLMTIFSFSVTLPYLTSHNLTLASVALISVIPTSTSQIWPPGDSTMQLHHLAPGTHLSHLTILQLQLSECLTLLPVLGCFRQQRMAGSLLQLATDSQSQGLFDGPCVPFLPSPQYISCGPDTFFFREVWTRKSLIWSHVASVSWSRGTWLQGTGWPSLIFPADCAG